MRKLFGLSVIIAFIMTALFVYVNTTFAISPPPAHSTIPLPSSVLPTAIPIDSVVNIPDVNLRHELHLVTGVPETEDLHKSDLKALAGVLALDNRNIANAEGIQYCKNIVSLKLSNNELRTLPTMSGMTGLVRIYLNNNSFETFPESVLNIPNLQSLYISGNKIESLPDGICSMPKLKDIVASNNKLYSVPEYIGNTIIRALDLRFNRIEALPESIGYSAHLISLDVALNRLTSLPDNLDDKIYANVDVEFNFIDMSSGSKYRDLMDGLTATVKKNYKRQLTPLALKTQGGPESVQLTWENCNDGAQGGAVWTVNGYIIYLRNGGDLELLSEPEKGVISFEHTDLIPETEYLYRVGVKYTVYDPVLNKDVNTIGYVNTKATASSISTLPTVSAEPSEGASSYIASPTVSAESFETHSVAVTPSAEPPDIPVDAQENGAKDAFPTWAIIVIAIAGACVLGTGLTLGIMKYIKAKNSKSNGI